jgi:hypothetical protein
MVSVKNPTPSPNWIDDPNLLWLVANLAKIEAIETPTFKVTKKGRVIKMAKLTAAEMEYIKKCVDDAPTQRVGMYLLGIDFDKEVERILTKKLLDLRNPTWQLDVAAKTDIRHTP